MKKQKAITAGAYLAGLEKKAGKIERTAKKKRIRRIVLLVAVLLICGGAVFLGITDKDKSLQKDYHEYVDTFDRSMLYTSLLEYNDTLNLFEQNSLGNRIIQSQMGGFFYDDGSISIYPDALTGKTTIEIAGKKSTLSSHFASSLNVFDGNVYYRDTKTLELMKYDISSHFSTKVGFSPVGQFCVVDGLIVVKDNSAKSLNLLSPEGTIETVISEDTDSFSIVGNEVIYLKSDHSLHSFNLNTHSDVVIGRNINSFLYNGKLWLQNNTEIFYRALSEKELTAVPLNNECHKLLGITNGSLLYESDNGICRLDLTSFEQTPLDPNLIFVGASGDGRIFVYQTELGNYSIISQ